jgi:hypothetical protein
MICSREDELLDALGRGYLGAELTSHIATCSACSELHTVAGALLDERIDAMAEAPVPSAGTMWFRLQMRHRKEIQTAARRSLLIGQAVTLMIAVALIATLLGARFTEVRELVASVRLSTPLMFVIGTWALLAPIGGYIAIKQK